MTSPLRTASFMLACALASACSSDESGPELGESSDPDMNMSELGGSAGSGGSGPGLGEPYPPGDRTPRPSAGCELANAMPIEGPDQSLLSGGQPGRFDIRVPSDYDGTTPYPLGFVFHGANNDEQDCRRNGNCAGVPEALEGESIVIYPKSFGTAWTDAERDQNVTYFDDLLAHAKANYCIDERRVYAVGTSSGAHFTNILACRRGDQLLAVVPGAGERLETTGCVGRVAALVIHGVDDTSVPFAKGEEARDAYAEQNGCSGTTPAISEIHATVRAARDAQMETHACADYQNCMDGLPVRWCEHSVGGYDGSTHGWPFLAGQLTWDFVRDL